MGHYIAFFLVKSKRIKANILPSCLKRTVTKTLLRLLLPNLPVHLITKNQLLLPTLLGLHLPFHHAEVESDKVSNSFGLQNIFNLLSFSLVHIIFFSLFIETFSSIF